MATELDVRAPEQAPTRPTSWTDALIAWRAAERQLASIPAGSPEGNALRAEIEALRLLYKELSGQFAARATPVARAAPVAQATLVALATPVTESMPVAEVKPVGRPKAAPRGKPAAPAKPAARPKLRPQSARAG